MSANAYSFLPWLRLGLTTRLTADPGTAARASIPVKLLLTGDAVEGGGTISGDVEKNVQLYGPGDVVGLDPRVISRMEPRPWITNVEPNYLAHIEFYDEDLLWRYSPAPPDAANRRLPPWLALVVLAGAAEPAGDPNAEFTEDTGGDRPLPSIVVKDPAATLPPPAQLGAWAHVHVNGGLDSLIANDDPAAALAALKQVLSTNADLACSRLMCPRRLKPNTGYHAFLVPAFETGRLAGLGLDPAKAPGALHSAWGPDYPGRPEPGTLPYYHRWYFGTGSAGDFEYLVRLLEPRTADPRIGRRDIDVHNSPGPGLPGITTPAELGGVLKLGGALQVPGRPEDKYDRWDQPYPHPFQRALADLINLAEDYLDQTPAAAHAAFGVLDVAGEVDPIITPPLYGRWHAPADRLLTDRAGNPITPNRNWVHRLNLDPRFRVGAHLGTRVIQERQEEFMDAAWAQVGDVLAANAKIRAAQLAREVGHVLQAKHVEPAAASLTLTEAVEVPSGRALALTAPASSRVTVLRASPGAAASDAAERVAVGFHMARSRVTAVPLSPAMRRMTRPGSRLIRTLPFSEGKPPDALVPRMDDESDPVTAAPEKQTPDAVVTPAQLADVLHPAPPPIGLAAEGDDPAAPVDQLPHSANFVITLPGDTFVPSEGGEDSPEAKRLKDGLRDIYRGWHAAGIGGETEGRDPLNVPASTEAMLKGLRADQAVPNSLLSTVKLPDRLQRFAEKFIEAMAYPVIDLPMYRALLDLSVDYFVPNLGLVPQNTVTLLETNQAFIESYLVGLNHEMARELLWREYPTDQRGSPFRQFWDVRTVASPPGETPEQRRERLYDIRPIHTWPKVGELGHNDNRETGEQADDLVLVIRGDLLKKYPNAAIYAHRARWQPKDGPPDPSQERVPVELDDPAHPRLDEIRLPLYEAKVEPDLYLLGFDLTAAEAKGSFTTGQAGWFFVIQERPGDPRFGADEGPATRVEVWNDLSWSDVDPGGTGFIRLDANTVQVPLKSFDDPDADQEKNDQHLEDQSLPVWHGGLSSADVAYMLFQAPVLMAVHAQEMLL